MEGWAGMTYFGIADRGECFVPPKRGVLAGAAPSGGHDTVKQKIL
jgi:hypothetical protein